MGSNVGIDLMLLARSFDYSLKKNKKLLHASELKSSKSLRPLMIYSIRKDVRRMQKLYIIGAGCSKNYTEGTTTIQGLVPPLDRDFFQMAKKVILNRKMGFGLKSMLEAFIFDIYRLYGHSPSALMPRKDDLDLLTEEALNVLDDPNLSLEGVMTTISLDSEMFIRPPCVLGVKGTDNFITDRLAPLIELIAVTISESLSGPRCSKHRKLAESLTAGDLVISYNYDLLMDNALRDCGMLTDNGYLLQFQRVSSGTTWDRPNEDRSQVKLLKLHGSLNWMHCIRCDSKFMMRNEKMDSWMTSIPEECPICREDGSNCLERLLVPPLLTKDYSDHAINYLWSEAHRQIRTIREIVAIGYSLPPTDFASETLLRTSLEYFQRHIPLTLVNPSKEAFKRYSEIFAPDKITWIESLDSYLDAL